MLFREPTAIDVSALFRQFFLDCKCFVLFVVEMCHSWRWTSWLTLSCQTNLI